MKYALLSKSCVGWSEKCQVPTEDHSQARHSRKCEWREGWRGKVTCESRPSFSPRGVPKALAGIIKVSRYYRYNFDIPATEVRLWETIDGHAFGLRENRYVSRDGEKVIYVFTLILPTWQFSKIKAWGKGK